MDNHIWFFQIGLEDNNPLLVCHTSILGILIIVSIIRDRRDEKWLERHGKPFAADGKINEIAEKVCNSIKRVELLYVSFAAVYIQVESQSGNSTWNCKIDFNDHGTITGEYKITSDNDQSNIPQYVADEIADEIKQLSIEELYES